MPADTTRLFPSLKLKVNIGTAAAADTNIAVANITTADTLLAVIEVVDPAATTTAPLIDRSATSSITSAGNIQCTASTIAAPGSANNRVIVLWNDAND